MVLQKPKVFQSLSSINVQLGDLMKYTTTTGTANSMSVSLGTFDFTKDGNIINIVPNLSNTGACTITVNGTSKAIKKFDTASDSFIDLASEDLKKNTPTVLSYNVAQGFFVYAPKNTGAVETSGWAPLSGWQDISNPPANTINMLFSDQNIYNAFTITTGNSSDYTITITGASGNFILNGTEYALGTPVSVASATQCNITFTKGTGQTTDYGYTTFKVAVTSTGTITGFKMSHHPSISSYVISMNSLLWCVINAEVTSLAEAFYCATSMVTCNYLQACKVTSTALLDTGINVFQGTPVVKVELPSNITVLGNNIFNSCSFLSEFDIPQSVTTIGDYAFSGTNLKSFTLPNGLLSIGTNAFAYCMMESLELPETLTTIGNYAFTDCDALVNITIPSSVTSLGSYVFDYCDSLKSVNILANITTLPYKLFAYCTKLESFTIPASVTTFGDYIIDSVYAIRTLSIPSTVTTIGTNSFGGAKCVKSITGLENLTMSNANISLSGAYELEAFNTPNITYSKFDSSCSSSQRYKLHSFTFSASSTFTGTTPQINIAYNSFSTEELNTLFTSLPTVTSKTIKVTGNPGAGTCDTSIATAKGWTVTIV